MEICNKMKRPTKKPQLISKKTDLLETYKHYTPEDFEAIASAMRNNNIEYLEPCIEGYGDCYFVCYEYRHETPEEADKRYKKELEQYKNHKAQMKDRKIEKLKKLAKELNVEVKIS